MHVHPTIISLLVRRAVLHERNRRLQVIDRWTMMIECWEVQLLHSQCLVLSDWPFVFVAQIDNRSYLKGKKVRQSERRTHAEKIVRVRTPYSL